MAAQLAWEASHLAVLPHRYERAEITKEGFKVVLKKTADKVVNSYKKEGMPPPANNEIVGTQKAKIAQKFEEAEIDPDVLPALDDRHLKQMGLGASARNKITSRISMDYI